MNKTTTNRRSNRIASYKHVAVQRFVRLAKPLQYPVYCGSKCVIPAGAVGVCIRFRASHLHRYDEALGREVPLNVYLYRGRVYHA